LEQSDLAHPKRVVFGHSESAIFDESKVKTEEVWGFRK
jgi:hypothetical protein